jgi:hypothetical protein
VAGASGVATSGHGEPDVASASPPSRGRPAGIACRGHDEPDRASGADAAGLGRAFPDAVPVAHLEPDTGFEPNAEPDSDADAYAEPQPHADSDAYAYAQSEPESERLPEPQPDRLRESEPERLPEPQPDRLRAPEPDRLRVGHRRGNPLALRGDPVISVWVVGEIGALAAGPSAGLVAVALVSRKRIRARDWRLAHPPRHARPKPPSTRTRSRRTGGAPASRREQFMLPVGSGGQQDGR